MPEEKQIQRWQPDPEQGLTAGQVRQRVAEGLYNRDAGVRTKTVGRILLEHTFTLFNLLNFALALLVILVGSYKNALFMGVIFSNIAIGAFQEIRAKRTIDRLALVTAPHAIVLRDGKEQKIAVSEVVLDDVTLLRAGARICSDAVVMTGEVEVNEALLTGESDPIRKRPGELLLSGSFIVSGSCRARVEHVAGDNYASRIVGGAGYIKAPHSEILLTLKFLVKNISIALVPVGLLLFCKACYLSHTTLEHAVTSTVAALVGMIPEGLVLLTSTVFAVSVVRLARCNTLVQQLYCSESLARVDVLCLDKTGTITTGAMQVEQAVPADGFEPADIENAAATLLAALTDSNQTLDAVRAYFTGGQAAVVKRVHEFSSARKWSGAELAGGGCIVMGAPAFVLPGRPLPPALQRAVESGSRVLVLAQSAQPVGAGAVLPAMEPVGYLLLSDTIRETAVETVGFFAEQGVSLKIISGDDPFAVSAIARRAGVTGADRICDASQLAEADIPAAVEKYSVFGRVTPQQKLEFVRALRAGGHTVGMTGDGVNDVLALKEADCGIAMAAGSEAARTVSDIVLLDSNFASLPKVVREGRRSINNLERPASLFLTKTLYASAMAVLFLFLRATYPFQPINLTLVSTLTIGIPSFVLAMEPNSELVRGRFLANVLGRALPSAAAMVLAVVTLSLLMTPLGLTQGQLSSMAVVAAGTVGFLLVFRLCCPFNALRTALFAVTTGAFVGVHLIPELRQLFSLERLTTHSLLITGCMMIGIVVFYLLTARALERFTLSRGELFYPARYIDRQLGRRRPIRQRRESR